MSFLKLIIKNSTRNRTKSILTIMGFCIAIFLNLTVTSVYDYSTNIENNITNSKNILITIDNEIVSDDGTIETIEYVDFNSISKINESQIDKIKNISGVINITPIQSKILLEGDKEIRTLFLEENDLKKLGLYIIKGKMYVNDSEVIIGKNYKTDSKIGDNITLDNKSYAISGIFSGNIEYLNTIILNKKAITKMTSTTSPDELSQNETIVSINDLNYKKNITKEIKKIQGITIHQPSDHKDLIKFLEKLRTMSIIISIIMIFYTSLSSIDSRTHEIGILKAMGWKNKEISYMLFCEITILSLISWIIGSLISVILIEYGISGFLGFDADFNLNTFVKNLVLLIIISLIGSLYPIFKATKISAVEAMRYE